MLKRTMMAAALVAMLASRVWADWSGRVVTRSGNTWFSSGPDGVRTTIWNGNTTYRFGPSGSSFQSGFGSFGNRSSPKSSWGSLLK